MWRASYQAFQVHRASPTVQGRAWKLVMRTRAPDVASGVHILKKQVCFEGVGCFGQPLKNMHFLSATVNVGAHFEIFMKKGTKTRLSSIL